MNARSSIWIFVVVITMLFASQVQASQRVLIRFDQTGHHLHRVVAIAPEKFVPQSDSKEASLTGTELQRYGMQIQWFDASGYLLATDYQADPRVSHTPSQKRDSKPTFVRLLNGAYVITGPAEGTLLQISLPSRFDVGLAAETWQIYLPQ